MLDKQIMLAGKENPAWPNALANTYNVQKVGKKDTFP